MPRPPNKPIGIFPPTQPSQPGDTPSANKSPNKPVGLFPSTGPSQRDAAASASESNQTGTTQQSPEGEQTFRSGTLDGTLNRRLLVISALIVLGIVGIFFLTHRLQHHRLTVDLLALADTAAENDPKRAQRLYRDYLKLRQDDLDVRIKLAEVQMQTADSRGQWMAAFHTNEAVLRADAEQTGIRRQQVQNS